MLAFSRLATLGPPPKELAEPQPCLIAVGLATVVASLTDMNDEKFAKAVAQDAAFSTGEELSIEQRVAMGPAAIAFQAKILKRGKPYREGEAFGLKYKGHILEMSNGLLSHWVPLDGRPGEYAMLAVVNDGVTAELGRRMISRLAKVQRK